MSALKKHLIFGLVLFFSLDLYALDWTDQQEKYIQRIWTIESGLPQNTIQTLIQTQDGYLWIGTPSGLARFDGVKFTVFTKQNTPALKNDNILSLYEDSNKILWIGTDGGGLCSYQNGIWENFSRRNGLSNNHIRSIIADWKGHLWIGTDYGLNRMSGDDIKIFTIDDGLLDNIITTLNIDNTGGIWVGTLQGGLARIDQESIQVFDHKDGLRSLTISTIHIGSNRDIGIGTFNGVFLLDRTTNLFDEIPWTHDMPITTIVETNPGLIWIGTMVDGVQQTRKYKNDSLSGFMSLGDEYIRCMLIDREGHIWIGTDTAGLIQLKLREVQAITRDQGLPENGVSTLLEDRAGNLWIGLRNKGLCKISVDGVIETISDISGSSNQGINALFEDMDGAIWCGTRNNGLFRIKKDRPLHLTTRDGLSANAVTSILRDQRQILWIGTEKGLCSYRQGKLVRDEYHTLNDKKINLLFEGKNEDLYAGTEDGLYRLSESGWENLDTILSAEVLSLYEDKDAILWIGTNGSGLKIWMDGKLSTITEEQGLYDDNILSIYHDANDNLWMSTYDGVFRIKRKALLNLIQNKEFLISPVFYNENDGMPSRQCSGNVYPSVWKTRDGKLLYPTIRGVSVFNPDFLASDSIPPQIILEDLMIDETSVMIDHAQLQSFSGNEYDFYFTAIDFSGPEKLRFEYMLEGYDSRFTRLAPDQGRHIAYNNLGPGMYRLQVRVINHEGVWNHHASLIEFEVFTPFYIHPVFMMLVVMFVLTVSSGIVYLRHQKRVSNQIEKYKTSRLTKEMTDKAKEKIKTLMVSERLYLDPDLSLKDLSSRLKIHSNYISRIINEQFKMSYNDYVNMYRIEEVKQNLSDPEKNAKTVLEIMYETGFYSKSVFNTAFKKFTGVTPSEFRRTHI